MSNSQTSGLWRRFTKKINWHNEVHTYWCQFYVRYEGHQNCLKILSMNILRVFSDHHLWRQNWCQYVWTSLCQFNFLVNLLHSLGVWFFDIWHLFDNLTSFWHFGYKLTMGPLPMCPIAHTPVPHCPCTHCPCDPYPCTPIAHLPHTLVPHTPSGSHCPYAPYPLYPISPCVPIAYVPHTPCTHLPCGPHWSCAPHTLYPISLCPHCPCGPYSMCPMAHVGYTPVPHTPCTLLPHVPHCPSLLSPLGNGPYG